MAFDKVVDSVELDNNIKSVADAIRAKSGTADQLVFPEGLVSAIGNISSNILPECWGFSGSSQHSPKGTIVLFGNLDIANYKKISFDYDVLIGTKSPEYIFITFYLGWKGAIGRNGNFDTRHTQIDTGAQKVIVQSIQTSSDGYPSGTYKAGDNITKHFEFDISQYSICSLDCFYNYNSQEQDGYLTITPHILISNLKLE